MIIDLLQLGAAFLGGFALCWLHVRVYAWTTMAAARVLLRRAIEHQARAQGLFDAHFARAKDQP